MTEPTATLPRVSFIVPVYNDARRLEWCLRSILANHYPADRVELVVADNGSTDGSAQAAKQLGATVVTISGVRVAELRNRASQMATGDVLAFVDADHEIVPDWTTSAVDSLKGPGVGASGAVCEAPTDGTWVQHAYGYLRGYASGRHDIDWLASGNLVIWRKAFAAIDGFDVSLEACEDVDLCHRLITAGYRVVSDDRLRSIHHGDPATLWQLFRSELWRGRDNVKVSFRRPLVWRKLPSAVVPIVDVALIAIALLTLLTAGSKGMWLSGIALLLTSVPSWLRVFRAALRHGLGRNATLGQAFAVAGVYDIARALALLASASHPRRSATT